MTTAALNTPTPDASRRSAAGGLGCVLRRRIPGPGGAGCPGEETPLGARFDWAGREWLVPAAYSCAQGLVLDIAMRAEAEAVRAFMEKWAAADMSGRAARLRAKAENPIECDFTASVCVNGRVLRQKSAYGTAWGAAQWPGRR